jgi:hypothetical protein
LPLVVDDELVGKMESFEIPRAAKKKLIAQLAFFGVHRYSMFPDLDGLSSYTNWSISSGEYWRTPDQA